MNRNLKKMTGGQVEERIEVNIEPLNEQYLNFSKKLQQLLPQNGTENQQATISRSKSSTMGTLSNTDRKVNHQYLFAKAMPTVGSPVLTSWKLQTFPEFFIRRFIRFIKCFWYRPQGSSLSVEKVFP